MLLMLYTIYIRDYFDKLHIKNVESNSLETAMLVAKIDVANAIGCMECDLNIVGMECENFNINGGILNVRSR